MNGRPALFCSKTSNKALAGGVSPETLIRPVPSRRWEATRKKAGNFSTSVKRSRTKGNTMQRYFNRRFVPSEVETGEDARPPSIGLPAEQWPSQASWSTAAVDTQCGAWEGSNLESCLA